MRRAAWVMVAALFGCGESSPPSNTVADSGADAMDVALAQEVGAGDVGVADAGARDVGAPDVGPADTGPMVGEYPEGPYGNREGDVLAGLSWEGYVNPTGEGLSTERTYGPTSLQALRAGGRYALVHVSEFY